MGAGWGGQSHLDLPLDRQGASARSAGQDMAKREGTFGVMLDGNGWVGLGSILSLGSEGWPGLC